MDVSADGLAPSTESATDTAAVEPGERGPTINTLDHAGQPFSSQSDRLAGAPQLFLFCAAGCDASEAVAALLRCGEELRHLQVALHLVLAAAPESCAALHRAMAEPVAVLADPNGAIAAAYG